MTSLVAVIVSTAVLATSGMAVYSSAHQASAGVREQVRRDAETVATFAVDRFNRNRILEFQSQLAAVIGTQSFQRFDVHDLVHHVTYVGMEGGRPVPVARADPAVIEATGLRRAIASEGNGQFRLTLPATAGGDAVAVVDVVADISLPTDKLLGMIGVACATAMVLIVAFVPLGLLFAQGIAQPLRRIARLARAVQQGNLDVEPLPRLQGEMGELTAALNGMVTHLRGDTAEIRRLAFTDTVTGLANRERFRLTLAYALKRAGGDSLSRAVIFVDLDHFKQVNDAFGHTQGDLVLSITGERLRDVIAAHGFDLMRADEFTPSSHDGQRLALVARHASDQFAVFLRNHAGLDELEAMGRDLCAAAKQAVDVDGSGLELGASIGLVDFSVGVEDPSEIMRFADLAMHEAKAAGGNRCSVFTPELDHKLREKLLTGMELRKAVSLGELRVHYMPKVPLSGGHLSGVEALVRWQHPRRGLLAPGAFIGIAEETGLVVEIDRIVLDEACRQASEWARIGTEVTVAVNISPIEFQRSDFVDSVLNALERHDLDPGLLELELTESIAMANPSRVAGIITQLRAVGIRFALDDFGTGYSNLGHLSTLSFDVLKIDQSFVRALHEGDRGDAEIIVETILSLAKNLGVETVAEGVETAEQAAYLESKGCSTGQGYYFGKPMSADEFEDRFLAQRRRAFVA